MGRIRVLDVPAPAADTPCCHCQGTGCPWDRLAGHPYCADCEEALVQATSQTAEGPTFTARLEQKTCCICSRVGTVSFTTVPLHSHQVLALDLCPEHLRHLLARRLNQRSFGRLEQQLASLDLRVKQVFLLHEAFYDEHGRALQPVEC